MSNKIVVIGSSNTDMVIQSDHLPAPGETVLGGEFLMNPGGKGANQAIAAAKLGGDVTFIARVGEDIFGKESIQGFQNTGIKTDFVSIDATTPSGVALIMVDNNGENSISVALGANAKIKAEEIDKAREVIEQASYVLIQLEIPLEVVDYAVEFAHNLGTRVVLNPAPAQVINNKTLSKLFAITPNETEAELLTGIKVENVDTAKKAANVLKQMGVENVIITLGSNGAYVSAKAFEQLIPSKKVKAVDTTAAGDTFNGALVVGLSEGMSLDKAVEFANKAAAISVTRVGAQSSVPSRNEIE